jgi:hypothetical protein
MKNMSLSSFKDYRHRWVAFFIAVAVLLSGTVYGQEEKASKTVVVMGKSVIHAKNAAAARGRAISNSLDSAVSLVTMNLLAPETVLSRFKVINEVLYNHTDRFIQNYKVLTETSSGKIYRVLVQASVSSFILEEKLSSAGIMSLKKTLPKIVFFMAEKKIEDIFPLYWWGLGHTYFQNFSERAMVEVLDGKGFVVIDPAARAQELELGSEYQKPDLMDQEAINIGLRFQADVVIIGNAVVDLAPNTMGENIKTYKGTVSARALRIDTGEVIASATQSVVTVNSDDVEGGRDALSTAGIRTGEALVSQIAAAWQKGANQPTLVTAVVEGIYDLKSFEMLRQTLNDMSGINEIQIKEMTPNVVTMVVDFQGNAKVMASALMLKTFDSFGLNISDIMEDYLRIVIVPR